MLTRTCGGASLAFCMGSWQVSTHPFFLFSFWYFLVCYYFCASVLSNHVPTGVCLQASAHPWPGLLHWSNRACPGYSLSPHANDSVALLCLAPCHYYDDLFFIHETTFQLFWPQHKVAAELLMEGVLQSLSTLPQPAIRVGLSGPPGAGKSTFIEALGMHLTTKCNQKVAVLVGRVLPSLSPRARHNCAPCEPTLFSMWLKSHLPGPTNPS